MGNDLKLQVLFDAVDKITGPLKDIINGSNKSTEALARHRKELKSLHAAQGKIAGFKKQKKALGETTAALAQAELKVKTLATATNNAVVILNFPIKNATISTC